MIVKPVNICYCLKVLVVPLLIDLFNYSFLTSNLNNLRYASNSAKGCLEYFVRRLTQVRGTEVSVAVRCNAVTKVRLLSLNTLLDFS